MLNGADVYVLPSYKEGLPISILEAMSYSLPVISTRVGGIPEIIMNGKNGLLINPGDKEALYESIIKLKIVKNYVLGWVKYQSLLFRNICQYM